MLPRARWKLAERPLEDCRAPGKIWPRAHLKLPRAQWKLAVRLLEVAARPMEACRVLT
jgi:hypothetical protein